MLDTFCLDHSCVGVDCIGTPRNIGDPLPTGQFMGDCKQIVCAADGDPDGEADDDTDEPADDGNECTFETCDAGEIDDGFEMPGAMCTDGGVQCDGAGNCVTCLDNDDCLGTETCVSGACVNSVTIGFCGDLFPDSEITAQELSTIEVYGQVYVQDVTDESTPYPTIVVEFGHGPATTAPSGWTTWVSSVHNAFFSAAPNNDEYMNLFYMVPAASGAPYDLGMRCSGDGGRTWTYGASVTSMSPAD